MMAFFTISIVYFVSFTTYYCIKKWILLVGTAISISSSVDQFVVLYSVGRFNTIDSTLPNPLHFI